VRIALLSNASYVPPRGGATRSNLAWLEALAKEGHQTWIVCSAAEQRSEAEKTRYQTELREQNLNQPLPIAEHVAASSRHGVSILAINDLILRAPIAEAKLREFEADWVLVSSEDLSHQLLRIADRAAPGKLIYVAHTPQFFPFGNESWHRDPEATKIVSKSAGIIAISRFVASHIESELDRTAEIIHPPVYEPTKSAERRVGHFDGGVGIINASIVKGWPIFLQLAELFPHLKFLALPGWATTTENLSQAERYPNVEIVKPVGRISEFFANLNTLLVPSLWMEGFGLVAMEAMAHGVTVVASDWGGLRNAKGDVPYLIAVDPIKKYRAEFDERHLPQPEVPAQNVEPWVAALQKLTTDADHWQKVRDQGEQYSQKFVSSLNSADLETYLLQLSPVARARNTAAPQNASIDSLTPAQKLLLLKRLQQKKQPS
jgi:glycosyltransferase involved in cell wall biosynthesis